MGTFSQIVDEVVARTGKAANIASISGDVNQTVRECSNLFLFYRDLVEGSMLATAKPHIWTRPTRFKKLRTVYYNLQDRYPQFIKPGRKLQNATNYFYGASNYFVLAGSFEIGDTISYAYYQRPIDFAYYTAELRPASFDLATRTWTYLTTPADEDAELAAQELVSHWLMQDYFELCVQGGMSKLFARTADQRAQAAYSTYKQLQTQLIADESFETGMVSNE